MVLQLASSPLASRPSQTTATSTSNSSPSSSNPASTTTASSILQLSFFGISKGKRQHHSSHQRRRQRTTSSSNLLHSFKPDQTHKKTLTTFTEQWRWAVFKTMVRLAAFSSALYPILIVPTLRTNGLEDGFGRGSQYLTIVGLLVTMICFGLSIVGDMLNKPGLITIKNRILPMLVPVECVISGLYWYLTLTNVFHIYPDGHKYLPFYVDIQMHGIPFLSSLVEMFFFSETLCIHRTKDICYYILFSIFYSSWSSFCAYMDGGWPYPILQNQASNWDRYSLMFSSTIIGLAIHLVVSEVHLRTRIQKALQ